jgi:hypothetical protein
MDRTLLQPTDEANSTAAPDDSGCTPLPQSYGNNRLVLMARDPTWAHTYWDIRPARTAGASAALGNRGRLLLRLRDVASGRLVAEQEVHGEYGKKGMPFPCANRRYAAELSMVSDSTDIVLARSNALRAPPDAPSATASVMMIGRSDQSEALTSRLTLAPSASMTQPASVRMLNPSLSRYVTPRPLQLASEARLLGMSSAIRLSRRGSEGRLSRQLRFRGLRAVTRVIALPPRYIPVVIRLMEVFIGDPPQPQYQVRSAQSGTPENPVYVGGRSPEPVAGTYYVAYDSYGSMVVAPDQSAPSRGVPGTYYYYTGNGWVSVEIGPDGGTARQSPAVTPDAGTQPDAGSQPNSPNVPNLGPDPFQLFPPGPGRFHLLDDNEPFQISPELLDILDQEITDSPDGADVDGGFGIDGGTLGGSFGEDASGLFGELGFDSGYGEGGYGGGGFGDGGSGEGGYYGGESGYGESGGGGYGESGGGYGESGGGGYGESGGGGGEGGGE